jgi:hypothetical protein
MRSTTAGSSAPDAPDTRTPGENAIAASMSGAVSMASSVTYPPNDWPASTIFL